MINLVGMEFFVQHVEALKTSFEQMQDENQLSAIELMEETLNWMTYQWEEKHLENEGYEQYSRQCLVKNAEEIILDEYGEDWQNLKSNDFLSNSNNSEFATPAPSSVLMEKDLHDLLPISNDFDYSIGLDEISSEVDDNLFQNFDITEMCMEEKGQFETSSSQSLYCFTCGVAKNTRKAMYRHGISSGHKTRDSNKKKKCIKIGLPSSSSSEVDLHTNELSFDEICSELIVDDNSLKSKLPLTKIPTDYSCYTCGLKFSNRKALYRHGVHNSHKTREKRAEPSRGGAISCEMCTYSTTTQSYLKRHLKRTHKMVL